MEDHDIQDEATDVPADDGLTIEAAERTEPEEGGDEEAEGRASHPRKARVSFEGGMAREEAAAYFETIVAGLKKGTLRFRQGGTSVELEVPSDLAVEIKASRKGDKAKIEFELSWEGEDD